MAITPGEWKLNKRHVDSSPYEILDSEGNLIAATIYGQHNGIDEARDNARLIAAAPDMLAALKSLDMVLKNSPNIYKAIFKANGTTIGLFEIALAKAQGKE